MRARQRSLPSLLFEDRVDYEWRQPLTETIADRSGFMLAQFTPPATAIQTKVQGPRSNVQVERPPPRSRRGARECWNLDWDFGFEP